MTRDGIMALYKGCVEPEMYACLFWGKGSRKQDEEKEKRKLVIVHVR